MAGSRIDRRSIEMTRNEMHEIVTKAKGKPKKVRAAILKLHPEWEHDYFEVNGSNFVVIDYLMDDLGSYVVE